MRASGMRNLAFGALCLLFAAKAIAQAVAPAPIRYAGLDSPPLASPEATSPSGLKGLYPEILDDILTKRMGLAWTGILLPWKRAQMEVQAGNADILITIPTEERRGYSLPSARPVLETYLYIYTYKDHPQIEAIRNIKTAEDILRLGLTPVTNLGNNWQRENIDSAGIRTNYLPAEQNIAKFLAAKRADIMIDTPFTMDRIIDSLALWREIEMTPARFGPIKFHILVGNKSPLATSMNKLNLAVEGFVLDGTRERLANKHLGKGH